MKQLGIVRKKMSTLKRLNHNTTLGSAMDFIYIIIHKNKSIIC